ncbi:uncharacterized protein LOC125711941 isoform X2 [Brienomyrus brachyistius]|uniref:uncharacterized protein LOC125711941 isoform X2 n=1 Tax=Brienomyrus brachyistius TaxID=42636 RepID=UPI0020B3BCB3|nr:uncharacterized protein LOC125711941 isoform X2 [Brienomyrus brachyistius]
MFSPGRTSENDWGNKGKVGLSLLHPDVLPYVVSQPMPWRVHYVSQSRRSSRTDEFASMRRNSGNGYVTDLPSGSCQCSPACLTSKNKAATAIQTQFRRYQQKKNRQK